MPDVFAYLDWRGDIPFSSLWINDVDTLIFSALAYVHYDGVVTEDPRFAAPLRTVARTILDLPNAADRCRCENDLVLLKAAGESERFGRVGVTCYRNVFDPREETQFAAITFLLGDGTAVLSFRGTDSTLVGWKEDFNMTFQESIPAQRLAKEYVTDFAAVSPAYMIPVGHSKGGNLAVYAAAKCTGEVQDRVIRVCNFDGPGFTRDMIRDPGYQRIVPRIRKLVPQSSVFGMLLEQEEDYTVIRSKSMGIFQHDPYSWEVLGPAFVPGEELTADSRFLDKTFKTWLGGMDIQERNEFFDTVFELLMLENASRPRDVMRLQHLRTILRTMTMDEEKRRIIGSVLSDLVESARNTHSEMTEQLSTGADEQR